MTLLPGLMQLANDETKTEARKAELAHAFMHEQLMEFYGPAYVAVVVEYEEAGTLPERTRTMLNESGCSVGHSRG